MSFGALSVLGGCAGFARPRVIAVEPPATPRIELAGADRRAGGPHQRDEKMYIVQREETHAEHLVRNEEMPDVRAAEAAAGRAIARIVQGTWIDPVFRALDVDASVGGEGSPV